MLNATWRGRLPDLLNRTGFTSTRERALCLLAKGVESPLSYSEVDEMDKPTAEQVAWVFEKLCEHAKEGGSYRSLIYDRMGFDGKAYKPLHKAGGMVLTNLIHDWRKMKGND